MTFDNPLDADRFFQILVEARGARRLRQVRFTVVSTHEPPQRRE